MENKCICESCFKATNGLYCPFVANLKHKIKGWKKSKDGKRIECPLYIYDYDLKRVESFLREIGTPLAEIEAIMERQKKLEATLVERENSTEQGYDYVPYDDDGTGFDDVRIASGTELLELLKEVLYGDEV